MTVCVIKDRQYTISIEWDAAEIKLTEKKAYELLDGLRIALSNRLKERKQNENKRNTKSKQKRF